MYVASSHSSLCFRSQTKDLKKKKKQSTRQEILITGGKNHLFKQLKGSTVTMEIRTVQTYAYDTNMNTLEYDKEANTSVPFPFKHVGKGKYAPIISQTWTMYNSIN